MRCCTASALQGSARAKRFPDGGFVDAPWVPAARRVASERLIDDCWRVRRATVHGGPTSCALEHCTPGWVCRSIRCGSATSLSSEDRSRNECQGARWRDRVFVTMARNAGSILRFLQHPHNRGRVGTRVIPRLKPGWLELRLRRDGRSAAAVARLRYGITVIGVTGPRDLSSRRCPVKSCKRYAPRGPVESKSSVDRAAVLGANASPMCS